MIKSFYINQQLVSQDAFSVAATDPARSVVIEACAGAGKTHLLVQRMVAVLVQPDAKANQILAITFTKKAAAEIEARLYTELQKPAHRGTYLRILQSGLRPNVCTFHAWFAELLQAAPLSIKAAWGVPVSYELLLDERELMPALTLRFYEEVLRDPALEADLLALFAVHGRTQTLKALEDALQQRTEFALCDQQSPVESHVEPAQTLYPDLAAALTLNTDSAYASCVIKGGVDVMALSKALGQETLQTWQNLALGLEAAIASQSLSKFEEALLKKDGDKRIFKGALDDGLRAQLAALQANVVRIRAAKHQAQCWRYQQSMSRLTRVWLACYQQLKSQRGLVDMQDLERWAWQLLSDLVIGVQVQERLDYRVQHLLVDECQDTNPLQWHALYSWLSGYAGAANKPSVFMVGDTKQSIYRFRRAEPRVFAAARTFLQHGFDADFLQCNHTRRCAPEVIAAVNEALVNIQTAGDYAGFSAHSTEVTERAGQVLVQSQITRDQVASGETSEAEQLAEWLASWTRKHPAHSVMVLAAKHAPLDALQQALIAQGLFASKQERAYLALHPAVQDMTALLSVLLIPGNNMDLARVLKSPMFGVSDEVLIALRLGDDDEALTWLQRLQESGYNEIYVKLLRWQTWLNTLPPFDALQRIYVDGNVLNKYQACMPLSMRAAGHVALQALLDIALQTDGGRFLDAHKLLRALKNPVQSVKMPALPSMDGQITLSTIHAAKGLEADVVIVMDMDAQAANARSMMSLVDWAPEEPRPSRFVFIEREGAPPEDAKDLLDLEHRLEATEEVNRLYVAMTRAREVLVLCSTEPHRKNPKSMWARVANF